MQVVAHNLLAQFTNRQLKISSEKKAKSSEKLSSGYRINRSADDTAGLQISEKMRHQIRGAQRAATNAQDGISLIQTADGALNEVHAMLQRINELAIQAATDTNQEIDRQAIQEEINQLTTQIDQISNSTTFNNMPILKTTETVDAAPVSPTIDDEKILHFQVGGTEGQYIEYPIRTINTTTLELTDLDVMTHEAAEETMEAAQNAINSVSGYRSYLGSYQNRLEHVIAVNDNTAENTQASESRIRDTNMEKEIVEQSKYNILEQSAQAMLTQANQSPQGILSLLQ